MSQTSQGAADARPDDQGYELFAFESDFVATLRCIPMAVRLKLDLSGIKLTLRQWSRLTIEERAELLALACQTAAEVSSYRVRLVEMVASRTGETAKALPCPDEAPKVIGGGLPGGVRDFAMAKGLVPPTPQQWRSLSPLRRFALVKLSRDNHDNVNFEPALREFGLWQAAHMTQPQTLATATARVLR